MTGLEDVTLLDALPDGVVLAGPTGEVELVNSTAARMLGIDRERVAGHQLDEVLALRDQHGRGWYGCNTPYDGIRTRSAIPEQTWVLPDGSEVLVTARLLRAGRGGPVVRVAVGLRSSRGRLRLDRERSDLVATVAHELRSPLTGVKGFVQALLNRWDKLSDEQKKLMLNTVHADADRLSRLITELLDVARLDTGRLSLYERPSDVSTLVARVIANVQAGAPHDIAYVAPDDLPSVWVDPDKFTQVVTNLVENAIRHGRGRVSITATAESMLRLVVDDQGEGISPEIRRRAFTKFWTQGARGGSGLGLYLVNGLVRAHGGTVEISDAPGGGARIVTTWPFAGALG